MLFVFSKVTNIAFCRSFSTDSQIGIAFFIILDRYQQLPYCLCILLLSKECRYVILSCDLGLKIPSLEHFEIFQPARMVYKNPLLRNFSILLSVMMVYKFHLLIIFVYLCLRLWFMNFTS